MSKTPLPPSYCLKMQQEHKKVVRFIEQLEEKYLGKKISWWKKILGFCKP